MGDVETKEGETREPLGRPSISEALAIDADLQVTSAA